VSLFGRLFGSSDAPSATRDPLDDYWFKPLSRRTASDVVVTHEKALTAPVVHDCLTVLSQTIAMLPRGVFERMPNGDKRRAENHPLEALFGNPDGESTPHEFFAQLVWDLAADGNALHVVEEGSLGFASRLPRIEPGRVMVERLEDGSRRWIVQERNGSTRRYVEGEIWHLRDIPLIDQLIGTSRLWVGREAIGALLALQDYGASYFANDATPPVFIKHPGHFADKASRENFIRAVSRWFGNKRKSPAVLEHGMEVQRIGNDNEEAQFLETRKELQTEIARLWRMPPHKVGIMERATFSNIEHQALEFVTDTLTPWIDLIEGAINRHLMLRPDRYFFEFDVSGLLRGDIEARFNAYAQARQWGWLSVNEIRRRENMNPIGRQGDQYLQPLNMEPAGSAGRDRRERQRQQAPEAEATVWGPTGRPVSHRIGGEWMGADHGA